MARRLRKKRIAIILITFTALIGWTTHSCVSRCSSSDEKAKADTLPKAHINDSISNALTEGKEYHEIDSVVERYLKKYFHIHQFFFFLFLIIYTVEPSEKLSKT